MSLLIRPEIFDHSVYPTPAKLTLQTLYNFFQNLNLLSNIDNKISLDQFKENIVKYLPGICQKDAEIYFLNYKIMTEDDPSFLINAVRKQTQGQLNQNQQQAILADVRGLGMYFFIQLYSLSARQNQNLDMNKSQFNEGFRGNLSGNLVHNFSPLNSPRSKATRAPHFSSELQQIIYFTKYNLKTILKLIGNDLNSEELTLTANEFNHLEFLFQQIDKQKNPKIQLSQYSNLFKTNPKININVLSEWLSQNINQTDQTDTLNIQGLTKSVMSKDESACGNRDIKIQNCEDSYIYIDSAVKTITIKECVNTTIFIAAASKVCSVEKCENLTLTVACNFLRVGNSVDSTIFYFGSYFPILYGDNRQITLGPNNTNYNEFIERVRKARIPILARNSLNFASPIILNQTSSMSFQLLPQKEFFPLILPSQFKPLHHSILLNFDNIMQNNFDKLMNDSRNMETTNIIVPILAPDNYREVVLARYKMHNDLQSLIKNSGISDEQQRLLHSAIQGHFREWLVTTGQIKPIQDLVKLIDHE